MKITYNRLFCGLLLSLIMLSFPGSASAQNSRKEDCKANKKANRHKLWQFHSYMVLEREYNTEVNIIRVVYARAQDSFYLYGPDRELLNTFLCDKQGRILSPVSLDYIADNGQVLTDSITPGKQGKRKQYFRGMIYSDAVQLTTDRKGQTKMYYDGTGKDSLWIVTTAGKLRLMTWYRNGKDSLQRKWDEKTARLEYEQTAHTESIWDADQRLVQHTFDTLVENKMVQCTKNWYTTGALASVTYHYFGQPCLNWKYYNKKGNLVQQVRKENLDKLGPVWTVERAPDADLPTVLQIEDLNPQIKELDRKLATLLCRTKARPEGTYRLWVAQDNTGKLTLRNMEGAYADILQPDMKAIFAQLPNDKSGKITGKAYAQLLQIELRVSGK